MKCFNCGEDGHIKAECPARLSKESRSDHMAVIDETMQAWIDGKISIEQKRRMISDENLAYYGEGCRKALLYP
jgi:hypothetical protein